MAASGKPQKILYSMGEVSEMFDVKPSLLRFWEGKFDILKPQKNKKGNRLFTPEDIQNLKVIYHLVKERGMTLAGAEKYMKASRRQIERDMELAERLQSIRALLAEVRDSFGDAEVLPDDVFDEIGTAATVGTPTAETAAETAVKEMTDFGFESEPEPEQEMTSAGTTPTADELMREAIAELEQDNAPEEMPDFEPEPKPDEPDKEADESEKAEKAGGENGKTEPETPPKPQFVEQTLFDF